MHDAINRQAVPGGVLLVAREGRIVFHKAYGYYTYDSIHAVNTGSVYDVASLTKILTTTLCIMKLYEEGKISLQSKLGDLLPALKNTNKNRLTISELLLHHSGLAPGVPVRMNILNEDDVLNKWFRLKKMPDFQLQVARELFVRNDWEDTIWNRVRQSNLRLKAYAYSDLGFLYLGEVIEKITGKPMEAYADEHFYRPLGLSHTTFRPLNKMPLNIIVPSEHDYDFRRQLIQGHVQDPTAAMLGGGAGNAGLFSTAEEVFILMQMLMNQGEIRGKRFFKPETVQLFTRYQNNTRRGLGFDKPEPRPKRGEDPYPAAGLNASVFGHTGYTGTCAWADPENGIIFIFLGNRLYPNNNRLFNRMNIRTKLQEAAYKAFKP